MLAGPQFFDWLFIEQAESFWIKASDGNAKAFNVELVGVTTAEREGNPKNNPVKAQLLAQRVKLDAIKK